MEYILQNTLLALLEYPGSTLIDVNRMLTNKTFRNAVIEKVTDSIVKAFWTEEFAAFTDTYTREATPAIQNKIGAFVSNPLIRNIIGQPESSFDLRKIMDEKKIFIVNLSKGRMGESNASLLGSMLTVKIYLAAMSRAEESAARMAKLPRCFFYVDEFQSMMNEAFADILSESRKYKLALTLANQYIEQMEEEVRDAVFGNVGTLITFRVGPFDAETLKTVFEPTFVAEDLVGLGIGQIYLTLMIDGVGSPPFSAETIPPIEAPNISYREDVITHSRAEYGRARADVEAVIAAKQKEFVPPPVLSKTQIRKIEGGGNYSRPSAPPQASPPAAPRAVAVERPVSAPMQPSAPVAQTPTPAAPYIPHVVEKKEADQRSAQTDQRSALRAAIAGARSVPTHSNASRSEGAQPSPVEILRARSNSSAPAPQSNPAFSNTTRYVPSRDHLTRSSRPTTPSTRASETLNHSPERRHTPSDTSAAASVPEEVSSNEISTKTLKRIIRGNDDGGHEQTQDI